MSGVMRQPGLWPWLTLLIASLGLIGVIVWHVRPGPLDLPKLRSRPLARQPASQPMAVERRRIRLFFPQEFSGTLKELERDIPHSPLLAEEIRAALREMAGGAPGIRPPLPAGTEVRQVFLDAFGIVYVDFGKGFQTVTAAPDPQPDLAISAIVTTLTTSFSEIKRVQFLVEGQEMTFAAGGWNLRGPVRPRFPWETVLPVVSQPQE